ncbi:MAG: carboxylating nicotinate-nucleotide diphosphorylase [Candidatus Lokiarchaeota archaeon]|nr:carboxylating nicotinate-nucleotide diphosphorylase [Candidatus Lokiarchaeota archaeon]
MDIYLELPKEILKQRILTYIKEDLGYGDITSNFIPNKDKIIEAKVILRENGIVSGIEEASLVFELFNIEILDKFHDGHTGLKNQILFHIKGSARDVLQAERLALNFLMKMSGISTFTNRLQALINEHSNKTKVASTRKTTPGFRFFEKKAVMLGGGDTHRFRLDDCIMIKNNHIKIANGITKVINALKKSTSFSKKIEVEVQNMDEAREALKQKIDIIMFDNFSPKEGKEALDIFKNEGLLDNVIIEFSGSIDESNIQEYAKLQPDIISLGALTHSYKALNINLRIL